MLSAYDQQRILRIAWDTEKDQGPFHCPECQRQVILKKGQFVVHHFAHAPGSNCKFGTGETLEHWQAKFEIYRVLRTYPQITDLQVELPLGPVRPDIIFCWEGKIYVVIEFQRSPLQVADVVRRTSHYTEKNIAVLWIILPRGRFAASERCSTRIWERFLYELYDNTIFCWEGYQVVLAFRLEPCVLNTEYRELYDRHAGLWRMRETPRYSKRLRIAHSYDAVRITDMKVIEVPAQRRGEFMLPKALLWSLEERLEDEQESMTPA